MNAYRLSAAVCALVFAALLGWTAWLTFTGEPNRVAPTQGVMGAAAFDDLPSGESAYRVLENRTRLQTWRQRDHDFPGEGALADVTDVPVESGQSRGDPGALLNRWTSTEAIDPQVLRQRDYLAGTVAYPGEVNEVLQQPAGRVWRDRHSGPLTLAGGWIVFGMSLLLALFLFLHGRIVTKEPYEGRTVTRFNLFERATHWMTAVSFILVALTGLILMYGQYGIKPLLGAEAYGNFALANVWLHMIGAGPFVLGVVVMAALWMRQNVVTGRDLKWIRMGGFMGDPEHAPPAPRFNAGQKILFWGVVLGMLALLATGVTLMFPFFWAGYDGMQLVLLGHAVIGLLMIALILGHIYIGTVGMERAIDAMWSGQVDRAWAHEHHRLWLEELDRKRFGEAPRHRTAPAE